MKVSLIGGMDRLEPHYRREAKRAGHDLKIFFHYETGMDAKIGTADAIILFTGKISHNARIHAVEVARTLNIPLYQCHSCGVCTLRDCLASLAVEA